MGGTHCQRDIVVCGEMEFVGGGGRGAGGLGHDGLRGMLGQGGLWGELKMVDVSSEGEFIYLSTTVLLKT